MIDILMSIWNVITGLVDFVIGIIMDLVYVIQLLAEFIINIPSYFVWLPSPVVVMIVTIFGIVVIYKVLGREG